MEKVPLARVLKQYKKVHRIDDNTVYQQVTISQDGTVSVRGEKKGSQIGRKRQFFIDLKEHPDTLIFIRQGVYNGGIGPCPSEVDECIVTENMPMFAVEDIEPQYLSHYLRSPQFRKGVSSLVPLGTAQKALHEKKLLKLQIPYPDKEYQIGVVRKLEKVREDHEEITCNFEEQTHLVERLRQAILREAMQGKLAPQDSTDEPASVLLQKIEAEKERLVKEKKVRKQKRLPPVTPDEVPYQLPPTWKWSRIGNISISYQNGISKRSGSEGKDCVVLRLADIDENKISYSSTRSIKLSDKEHKKYSLEKGNLLVTRVNGSADIVGSFTLVENDESVCYCDHFIRLELANEIHPKFIYYAEKSDLIRNQIKSLFITTAGQKTINQGHLSSLLIPLPPVAEQIRIVEKIESLMDFCDTVEAHIAENQKHSKTLMNAVLREAFQTEEDAIEASSA